VVETKRRASDVKQFEDELDRGKEQPQVVRISMDSEKEEKERQENLLDEDFTVKDLMQEDWRDLMATFYFPK